jgi:hypothetical protein
MEGGNEQHLAILLRKFSEKMYLDCVLKTQDIIRSEPAIETSGFEIIKTPDKAGDLAFRTSFDFPLYIMLSHPICKFRSHRSYPVGESVYIANLALVPVFFSSFNIMSVLKLWGERATGFFNPANSPLAGSDVRCWELPEASKPAQFSSMNFILQNGTDPQSVNPALTEIFEKYFQFFYWAFPHRGFAPSTHFLHGRAKVSSQVKIAKSLYTIEDVRKPFSFFLEGKTVEGTYVQLNGLTMDDGKFFFQSFPAIIDSELAEQILSRPNLRSSFINGVVAQVTQKSSEEDRLKKRSLLTVVADYGESYYDIILALTGMIVDSKFETSDSLTAIGTLEALSSHVLQAYGNIYRMLKVERTLSEMVSNLFSLIIDQMFPAIVEDNGLLFFIHPLAWGLLEKWKLVYEDRNKQKAILLHLSRLLQLSESGSSMKVFLDQSCDYFQRLGVNKREFTKSIFQLADAIRLLKTMRKIWSTDIKPST